MNGLALFAGIGGMELGLRLALGDAYRCVGYVEREAAAAATLVARMEDEALDRAPIWDDLTTFDGRPFRGRVDLVSSGLPCQPYSVAGKQRGHDDERALWPHFVRITRECEPALVFIENVPAFRKHFEPVWRELRGMGFEWAPPLLETASESGAPHIRQRFFALAAHPERIDLREQPWWRGGADGTGSAEIDDACREHPHAHEPGLEGRGVPGCERPDERSSRSIHSEATDADRRRRESEWCGWVFDGERQTFRHDAHGCGPGCGIRGSLWDSESPPVRVDARPPGWVERIRAVGNVGTPPVVYARAFLALVREVAL